MDLRPQGVQNGDMASRASLVALSALALCGFQAPPLAYNPQHYINNDPIWERLDKTPVTADRARGVYLAQFPAGVRALQGGAVRIVGFILPLEPSSTSTHFSLVRRNTACPFCPPNGPTEAVEVFARAPLKYTGEEVALTGRFELVSSSGDGLFYRLRDAVPAASSHRG